MNQNKFFLVALAVIFVVSLPYAIISWAVTGNTVLLAWIAPLMSGVFLIRELYERKVTP